MKNLLSETEKNNLELQLRQLVKGLMSTAPIIGNKPYSWYKTSVNNLYGCFMIIINASPNNEVKAQAISSLKQLKVGLFSTVPVIGNNPCVWYKTSVNNLAGLFLTLTNLLSERSQKSQVQAEVSDLKSGLLSTASPIGNNPYFWYKTSVSNLRGLFMLFTEAYTFDTVYKNTTTSSFDGMDISNADLIDLEK